MDAVRWRRCDVVSDLRWGICDVMNVVRLRRCDEWCEMEMMWCNAWCEMGNMWCNGCIPMALSVLWPQNPGLKKFNLVWQMNVSWYDKSEKRNVSLTKEILLNISDYCQQRHLWDPERLGLLLQRIQQQGGPQQAEVAVWASRHAGEPRQSGELFKYRVSQNCFKLPYVTP